MKLFIANNLLGLLIRLVPIMCVSSTKLSIASNKPHELGTAASRRSSPQLVFGLLNVTTRFSSTLMGWMWHIFCYMWMTSYWRLHPTIFFNILLAPCSKNLPWLILVIFITSWVFLPSGHPQVCSSLKLNMLLKFWTRQICHHAILAKLQLRFIPSCPPEMDHRLPILLYIAVSQVPCNT